MSTRTDTVALYTALALAAATAVMTTPDGEAYRRLQWLLQTDVGDDLAGLAGAVGAPSPFPVSP